MADASHLERMGRELKCPICLSLLNSAVSLTCNHVFCNSCIEKSMKAASDCPVCKVPYRRREIRPAPHMDNLVSVYKSMEVASGVNIFVTQTAASTKLSGEDNQNDGNIYEFQNNGQTKVEALDSGNQKLHQRKESKSASVTTQRSSRSNSEKPSFPTKKRVQVPQYTTSGTGLEHEKLEARIGEIDRNISKNCPALQKDMPFTREKQEPIFSPFFWLRDEEDLEKLSQQTDDNEFMYTPPDVPCFSDIKDSDDEAHCQITSEIGTHILSNNADFIDSEMFDWTQRPCSPELCTSPLAIQIEHTAEENGAPKMAEAALTKTTGISPNNIEGKGKRRTDKTSESKGGMRTSNKKVSNASEPRMSKRAKKTTCEVTAGDTEPGVADDEDAIKCQSSKEIQGARDQLEMEVPTKIDESISSPNGCVLLKCNTSLSTICCAFCQSSEESEASGIMVHYLNGKLVADDHNATKNAIHMHKNCTEWAPNVYFEDDNVVNLETELSRSRRIRCCCCGLKGAALGCYEKSCRKSFHVPCARLTPECRWDCENFVMLCPIHSSSQLPNEMPQSQSRQKRKSSAERKSCIRQDQVKTPDECRSHSVSPWKSQKKFKNLVFCCSALTNTEKEIVTEFENLSGVTILKNWKPIVTHVIASTDENGACRRTLKFLMGVLEGKWILSVQWIKACIEAKELVEEQQYEISVDIHGIRDGPKLGRLRLLNKQPKPFDGCTFYFMADFAPSYKGYLHDLVIAAGGKVLNRKPVAGDQAIPLNRCNATTFIIYSTELPEQCNPSDGSSVLNQRRVHAEALATSAGALVASNSWIMNSIAGCKLQKVGE